jgi:hypothetical protein
MRSCITILLLHLTTLQASVLCTYIYIHIYVCININTIRFCLLCYYTLCCVLLLHLTYILQFVALYTSEMYHCCETFMVCLLYTALLYTAVACELAIT